MLAANIFTLSGALIFLIFGIAYLYKSMSVKHHCDTIQKNFNELNLHNKTFLFALMRGVAGGALALAVTITYLQIQFFKHAHNWIPVIILISSSIFFLTSINGMILVKRNTTVKPPVFALILAMLLIIAGYLINMKII